MALTKCPRCELNYIRDNQKYCEVCRRELASGARDEPEEMHLCAECGENRALKGKDFCAYCLGERKRREQFESLLEKPAELDVEITQLDEIDVPGDTGIPQEDLQEIHREFGSDEDGGEDDEDDLPEAYGYEDED